jgi:RNA polymerase sigma-70 factor (ECF subfamily)
VHEDHPTTYCIVPQELAAKLHQPLRDAYRHDEGVEIVVERRNGERRLSEGRRVERAAGPPSERRQIRSQGGRRVGERRAMATPVPPFALPRKAERYASRLLFVRVFQPTGLAAEDADTNDLVVRFQAGDVTAFSDIYMRYFDRIYSYSLVALRNAHEAEDVTQQIFIRTLEALPRYEVRPTAAFRAWLFTVARNAVISQLQRHRRTEPMEVESIEKRQASEGAEQEAVRWTLEWLSDSELLMFIERLPLSQRQVLTLRFLGGLETAEIAEVLSRSQESVRQLQHRALRFLSDRLAAVGRKPVGTGRHPTITVLRQLRVVRRRRFALS